MKNAIKMTVEKAVPEHDPGISKFFGAPTVPNAWKKMFNNKTIFFCQIRLSDIVIYDIDEKLPHSGYLYFFIDTSCSPYKPIVMYYDGEPDTVLDDFNTVVASYSHLTEDWSISFENTLDDDAGLKLLGVPADLYSETAPVELLLQYDPFSNEMNFDNSLGGYMYFIFGKNRNDFSDVRLISEHS